MFDSYKIIFYLFSCSLCQSNHHHLIDFIIQQSILSATLQSLTVNYNCKFKLLYLQNKCNHCNAIFCWTIPHHNVRKSIFSCHVHSI